MTIEELVNNVESAISQYEQARDEEEILIQMVQDCERKMYSLSSQASSADELSDQKYALEQMKATVQQLQNCQIRLQQMQNQKAQAQRYLTVTRAELLNVIRTIEEKLPKLDQSIGIFEKASLNMFGSNASSQLPGLRAVRDGHQQNLGIAYNLVERIDTILNGSGTPLQKVLRR